MQFLLQASVVEKWYTYVGILFRYLKFRYLTCSMIHCHG